MELAKKRWMVCVNGRLPAFRRFATFEEAVRFVAEETGESENFVRRDFSAGCPTMCDDAEYDISHDEEART